MAKEKTLNDLKVDAHIAVLHTKVDSLIEKQKELTHRVRANEKVVAAIGLLGSIALAFIGAGYFAAPAEACSLPADGSPANCPEDWAVLEPSPPNGIVAGSIQPSEENYIPYQQPYDGMLPDNSATINNWMSKMRQWELEQSMKDPAFDINNALAEFWKNGSNGSTESEELLQLSSGDDRQSIGWRYDRRDDRFGIRPLQKGTGTDSGSGYSGEEN